MKKIGLISDTHAWWDDRYAQHFADCDEVWHAGDIGSDQLADRLEGIAPVFRAVCGNVDGASLRRRFKEMEIFTQFSSELDQSTTDLLNHGHMLTELLKQPLYNPKPHYEQVILLYAAQHGLFDSIPLKELKTYISDLMTYIRSYGQDIIEEIDDKKVMTDDIGERIERIVTAFEE